MQELIKKNYDKSALSEPKMEELKDDIKTWYPYPYLLKNV